MVKQARRRILWNEMLAQGVLSASVAMAGAILILLFGTQLLDWRWLAPLTAGTFLVACYRTSRRLPSSYRVAQIVDSRMDLGDALSTALYFSDLAGDRKVSDSMREAQRSESEALSRQVDPAAAIRFTVPRTAYFFGGLFLIAATLFAVRYGLERRLDLSAPLTRVLFDTFGGGFDKRAAISPKKKGVKRPWEQPSPLGNSVEDRDSEGQQKLDPAPDSVLDTVDVPDVNNDKAGTKDGGSKSGGKSSGSEAESENSGDDSELADQSSSQNAANGKEGNKPGDNSAGKQAPNAGENSSLASKLKDAMSNLLSTLRPKNGGSNPQSTPNGQSGAQSKSQQAKSGQKGSMGEGQKQSGSEQSADSEDGQAGEDAEGGKNAEGKSSGKSSDQQASHQPGSGMGKQDGAKDARLAEQLAAMGKISEIIGKRSANVTGEVTVEVSSSKQQLRTPYADSKAGHGEAGGEINRDEVPVALQTYVQQYFEQVRKQESHARAPSSQPPVITPPPTEAPR